MTATGLSENQSSRVSNTFKPGGRTVETTPGKRAETSAPDVVRKPPLTGCLTLAGRKFRSAGLVVNGTPASKAKASTPSSYVFSRLSPLRPVDCLQPSCIAVPLKFFNPEAWLWSASAPRVS
ncbi:hypothetical protein THII_2501 [Thioploca ingrica]|uniref:Uncharacterized protein n=1 Tax=Thioploca ingrica TaxID=40754 RepID=A0A090AFE2_9GAMM|nr:hypothetical protein THII_2501 [Thioploca ingrica]